MKIREFRFLTTADYFDKKYENWSRAYEYPRVLNKIVKGTVHNTACGYDTIHRQFMEDLEKFETTNSDLEKDGDIEKYDITKYNRKKYDYVLNISVLEHQEPEDREKAFDNLRKQTKKVLLLTMDYPRVDLGWLEDKLGQKVDDNGIRLNGGNSTHQNGNYTNLNIIVVEIHK